MHYTISRNLRQDKGGLNMDFMSRGNRPPQSTSSVEGSSGVSSPHHPTSKTKRLSQDKGLRLISAVLLFSVTVLLVALVASVMFGPSRNEARYVDSGKLQAVFLNGGQVYFGRISNLNSEYVRVYDIYYLRVNQTVQPDQENNEQPRQNDISLVKLGCELHGPQDEMVINRDQVIFWENLKDDGQVAKAVEEYKKQNPEGQKCNTSQEQKTEENKPSEENQNP